MSWRGLKVGRAGIPTRSTDSSQRYVEENTFRAGVWLKAGAYI
jgi:hypothetical protein